MAEKIIKIPKENITSGCIYSRDLGNTDVKYSEDLNNETIHKIDFF